MALLVKKTIIKAPVERCFSLSLSVDLHMESTARTGEKAIFGVTSGLMDHEDIVTWEARHLFKKRQLTSQVTIVNRPFHFISRMLEGDLEMLQHDHIFEADGAHTIMTDRFFFKMPFGIIGMIAEKVFFCQYFGRFLRERNDMIKSVAESDRWKEYLKGTGGDL